MSPRMLWLAIEPVGARTQLFLSESTTGTVLKARFPALPAQPEALVALLEGLAGWFGLPLCAVLDADGRDVQNHPEVWSRLLADVQARHLSVEWVATSLRTRRRDGFLAEMRGFGRARQLLKLAALGQA
jgi:hypothetical protein